MSILRMENSTSESATKSKRADSAKSASVSFGEVYVQGSEDLEDDLTCDGDCQSLLPDPRDFQDKSIIRISPHLVRIEENGTLEVDTKEPGDERTSAKSKHDKVTFCDKDISTPGRPRQSSPTTYSEIIILDSPPAGHWPLKRSASLESRDNPFLPGGDLEKEAEDILKRATIVRDRFFLEGQKKLTSDNVTESETSPLNTENTAVEESIAPQTAESMNCEPNAKPRQNGKVEDSSVSPTSKKPEVGHDTPDGVTVTDDTSKDKKKQKKCCNVM